MSIASVFVSVEPLRGQKDTDCFVRVFCLVGVARLELAALRSRTVRATKLRYTPINMSFVSICCGAFGSASRISVRSCAFVNRFGDMFLFLKCTSFDSLNFSQTKLRYTPINMCFVSICCGAFGSASRISVRSCALNNSFDDMFLFLKCTSFDSLNFSQTKLRYTPIFSCCQF